MARIQRFTNRAEADVACGLLVAHGLHATVMADDSGGQHPNLPHTLSGTAVVVPDGELEEALALLDSQIDAATLEAAALESPPADD